MTLSTEDTVLAVRKALLCGVRSLLGGPALGDCRKSSLRTISVGSMVWS